MKNKAECHCCGYKTTVKEYEDGVPPEKAMLCEICASTLLSMAFFYPNQVSDTNLYKSIGYIGNMLLEAVKRKTPKAK